MILCTATGIRTVHDAGFGACQGCGAVGVLLVLVDRADDTLPCKRCIRCRLIEWGKRNEDDKRTESEAMSVRPLTA